MGKAFDKQLKIVISSFLIFIIFLFAGMTILSLLGLFRLFSVLFTEIALYVGIFLIFTLFLNYQRVSAKMVKKIYKEKPYLPLVFIASKAMTTVERAEKIISKIKEKHTNTKSKVKNPEGGTKFNG